MFKYFKGFEFTVKFGPEIDKPTFGDWLVNDYTGKFTISVNDNGDYTLRLAHKFTHDREHEKLFKDQSFAQTIEVNGNFKDFVSSESRIKETVHEQYRDKKKVITILPADV